MVSDPTLSPAGNPSGNCSLIMARRCCRKPRKGAMPVPGPTMITGLLRSLGGLKSAALRSTIDQRGVGGGGGEVLEGRV